MKKITSTFPIIIPWILLFVFLQPLFFQLEFKLDPIDRQPLEILMESEEDILEVREWSIRPGILSRLRVLSQFIQEFKAVEIPSDGFTEDTYERMNRIIFGQKLIVFLIFFLALLSITSFISWIYRAWFRMTLNKILYWVGLIAVLNHIFLVLPHTPISNLAVVVVVFYLLLGIGIGVGIRILNRYKHESVRFEVLKHSSELDEEGKKPTYSVPLHPLRVGYHFSIIILVGLLVGNLIYIPLFLLQKHFAYQFGILILVLIAGLCAFYIRNYTKISEEKEISKIANILTSLSYLQYKFLRNLALGIGGTVLVIVFVTVLFSILILNADFLRDSSLGVMGTSSEL